ncbi:MAG: hypothetical protein NUK63_10380 [Candidatus Bathyarchaeum tardum]|nr:MAG: hypothetical protein NUK63_10380 [Candidatus Bathyarchaeum tardum]
MKQLTMLFLLVIVGVLVSSLFTIFAEASMMWSRTYGGDGMDICVSSFQTGDGGVVLFGHSYSFGSGVGWLVKADAEGDMQWNKTIDWGSSCVQTNDGGFIFVGTDAFTFEGYIPVGQLPDGFWSYVWLAKTDEHGNMEWNQTYDAEVGHFNGASVTQTSDGGYALLGNSFSSIGDSDDFLLIKTDSLGNKEWSKLYNYSEPDRASGLIQTHDGGFVFIRTLSTKFNGFAGFLVMKTDSVGNVEWNQTDLNMQNVHSFVQVFDGSLVFAGYSRSLDYQSFDFCMTKLDSAGNIKWTKNYGLHNMVRFPTVIQTSDGGFAVASYVVRPDDDRLSDFLLIKTDEHGKMQWNQTFIGNALLGYPSLFQTMDGDYILSGALGSWETGDYDFWLIKAQTLNEPSSPSLMLFIFVIIVISALIVLLVYSVTRKLAKKS